MKIGTETPTGRKQERNKKSRKGLTVDLKGIKVKGAKKFLGFSMKKLYNNSKYPLSLADKKKFGDNFLYAWGEISLANRKFAEEEAQDFQNRGFPAMIVKRATGYQVYTSAEGIMSQLGDHSQD